MSIQYQVNPGFTNGMWANVVLEDNLTFEGLVVNEMVYGIYLAIGGDSTRLSLFPWDRVTRVIYKTS